MYALGTRFVSGWLYPEVGAQELERRWGAQGGVGEGAGEGNAGGVEGVEGGRGGEGGRGRRRGRG